MGVSGGSVPGCRTFGGSGGITVEVSLVILLEPCPFLPWFLPARASELGNVIGLVSVYIFIYTPQKL